MLPDYFYYTPMRIVADLHIHSKHARAVSRDMVLEKLDAWADDKGIPVMGTGDFTHPAWILEIQKKLEPAEPGLFKLRSEFKEKTMKGTFSATRFMLTTEVASIYSRGGRGRRVHNLIFAPDIETVLKINKALSRVGNLKSDGRPIIGIDAEDLLKIVLDANPRAALVPAHIWTPWFAIFGSMSGFDSLEECFGDNAKHIFAIETGLSSDPPMNWRISALDRVALISNSDSHSLQRIGREANVFDCELSYDGIIEAIKAGIPAKNPCLPAGRKDQNLGSPSTGSERLSRFTETIEFYPEEGRYHIDGHRMCGVAWTPEETARRDGICTKCGGKVTRGTMGRVAALADRPEGYTDEFRVPFRRLVPLDEIIGAAFGVGHASGRVQAIYRKLICAFGSELNVVLSVQPHELATVAGEGIAEGVVRVREGKISIKPGYDGEYGEIKIFHAREQKKFDAQRALF